MKTLPSYSAQDLADHIISNAYKFIDTEVYWDGGEVVTYNYQALAEIIQEFWNKHEIAKE